MDIHLNKLYGILTDGDNTYRKTTESRSNISADAKRIVEALIPDYFSEEAKRALAELYIRLIESHKKIAQKLETYEGISSYKLHSIVKPFNDKDVIEIVVKNIKALGIRGEEQSFLPLDYIVNALDKLLDELNG